MGDMKLAVLTPLYNDWNCLPALLEDIEQSLAPLKASWHLFVVNDCSTTDPPGGEDHWRGDSRMTLINLITNLGHQRAILTGLCYLFDKKIEADYIIVLDSDGEDRPQDIPLLLAECQRKPHPGVVFAKRAKRSEGWRFIAFYQLYKMGFRMLTGRRIAFGNFSCFPTSLLPRICHAPDFWNHYSSALIKSRIPYTSVATDRGQRYSGRSKMNFNSLILHGLSSFSVYIETIIVRVLIASFTAILLLIFILFLVTYIRAFTPLAIPGWATFLFAILFNVILTLFFFNLVIILSHLNARKNPIMSPMGFFRNLIVWEEHSRERP